MALTCGLRQMQILHVNSPPFLNSSAAGLFGGVVLAGFQSMMASCCNDYGNISFTDAIFDNQSELMQSSSFDSTTSMPFYLSSGLVNNAPPNFIAVVPIQSLIVIGRSISAGDKLLEAVLCLWPIVVCVWGLSALSGYIMWVMETVLSKQNSTFDRNYIKGIFDAFWFSLITAATIGYGDFVIRCKTGKIFLLVWSTISSLMFATMTGTFTTIFNVASSDALNAPSIAGSMVGVPDNSINSEVALVLGGLPVTYDTDEDLNMALLNGDVDVILADPYSFMWLFPDPTELWNTYNFQASLLTHQITAGFMLPSLHTNLLSQTFYLCMQQKSLVTQIEISANLIRTSKDLMQYRNSNVDYAVSTLWSQFFIYIVLAITGSVLVLLFITQVSCVLAKKFRRSSDFSGRKSQSPASSNFTDTPTSIGSLDLRQIPEIQS